MDHAAGSNLPQYLGKDDKAWKSRCSGRAAIATSPQYSSTRAASAAEPGFRIERVMFRRPVPLAQGFRRAESIIKERGRPLTAFCACELRSARPFSDQGFREFNEHYVRTLTMGHLRRSNQSGGPQQCMPRDRAAGRALLPRICVHGAVGGPRADIRRRRQRRSAGGRSDLPRADYRYGETGMTPCGKRRCSCWARWNGGLGLLGQSWATTTATQVYTVHDLHPFFGRPDRAPRRCASRTDLALLPPARAGSRVRNGLPGRWRSSISLIRTGSG